MQKPKFRCGGLANPMRLPLIAAFLASPMASYVTGTVIPVDGGSSRFAY